MTKQFNFFTSPSPHLIVNNFLSDDEINIIKSEIKSLDEMLIGDNLKEATKNQVSLRKSKGIFLSNDNKILLEPHKLHGKAYKPKGCDKCDGTGYFGRVSIGEFIKIDKELSDLIYESASENKIASHVYKKNLTLFSNGINAVSCGLTSLAEIFRISDANE